MPDTIHPNVEGYEVLTPFIENFMIELAGGIVIKPPVSSTPSSSKEESTLSVEDKTPADTSSDTDSKAESDAVTEKEPEPTVAKKSNQNLIWVVVGVMAVLVVGGGVAATIIIIKSSKK